jgi:uncharacterized circularly permuted ATP-grasp superfamily protein
VADIFDGYQPADAWDEMFERPGQPRAAYQALIAALPALFAEQHVNPVDDYPARLLAALRAAAPPRARDPGVVVLTPGVGNAAYFEHALLARLMGVELVEGRDLLCSGNRVFVHTTGRAESRLGRVLDRGVGGV